MNVKMMEEIFKDTAKLKGINTTLGLEKFRKKFFEIIDVVDEEGNVIGTSQRGFAHRVGLRHYTVNLFIKNSSDQLLLQQRSAGVDNTARRLDVSAAGHVKAGTKDFRAEASRELEEELGTKIDISSLVFVAECNRDSPFNVLKPFERNLERRIIYEYSVDEDQKNSLMKNFKLRTSPEEVSAMKWYSTKDVADKILCGFAADGLVGTFPHYISFLLNK